MISRNWAINGHTDGFSRERRRLTLGECAGSSLQDPRMLYRVIYDFTLNPAQGLVKVNSSESKFSILPHLSLTL